jgi:hypothetical protein
MDDLVPQGRLKIGRDAILENLQPSLRDFIMSHDVPRTSVLGLEFLHFQSQGVGAADPRHPIL